jgi:hypothetical protein
MNICGCGSLFRPPSRVSPTMPTICRSAFAGELPHHAAADHQAVVQGVAFGPVLSRHRLVDDDDRRPAARRRAR